MANLIHNLKKTQVLFIGRLSASHTVGDSRPQLPELQVRRQVFA
jgi:hypothetical protein